MSNFKANSTSNKHSGDKFLVEYKNGLMQKSTKNFSDLVDEYSTKEYSYSEDGKLKEDDSNKQREEATTSLEKAKNDLAALEQKMQSGELKTEIEQAQQAYVQQLINNLKTTLAALDKDTIAIDDIIKSVLALEDDMQLSKEKATHERVQAKGKEKQVKNLQGAIKRGNAYGNARERYKSAVYREAYAEHKNEEIDITQLFFFANS